MSPIRHSLLVVGACLAVVAVTTIAGCSAAAPDAPASPDAGGTPRPTVPGPTAPGPTAVPNPGAPTPGATPDPGTDGGGGWAPYPGDIVDPGQEPVLVVPLANVRDVHDTSATTLEATVEDGGVRARLTWWSGVEPCTALAGIDVVRGEWEITLTIREGSAAGPDVMCTAQVIHKTALVDLGELAPGRWTIRATGEAPPVEVTVEG